MEGNEISASGLSAIASSLKRHRTITNLGLANNIFGDKGVKVLVENIKRHPSLIYLDLSTCEITKVGLTSICNNLLGVLEGTEETEEGELIIKGVCIFYHISINII